MDFRNYFNSSDMTGAVEEINNKAEKASTQAVKEQKETSPYPPLYSDFVNSADVEEIKEEIEEPQEPEEPTKPKKGKRINSSTPFHPTRLNSRLGKGEKPNPEDDHHVNVHFVISEEEFTELITVLRVAKNFSKFFDSIAKGEIDKSINLLDIGDPEELAQDIEKLVMEHSVEE